MIKHIKKFTIEEIENLIKEENINWDGIIAHDKSIMVDGYTVYSKSMRYKNFFEHGYTCCKCGKKGSYFYLDVDDAQNPKRGHFNLYSEDGTLMTKDHIVPKSKGGKNHIDNYQPMCCNCNQEKRNTMPKEYNKDMIKEIKPSFYIHYGPYKFCSFNKAINFAIQNIMKAKKQSSPQVRHECEKKARKKIHDALYNGQKYGNYEWKIEQLGGNLL